VIGDEVRHQKLTLVADGDGNVSGKRSSAINSGTSGNDTPDSWRRCHGGFSTDESVSRKLILDPLDVDNQSGVVDWITPDRQNAVEFGAIPLAMCAVRFNQKTSLRFRVASCVDATHPSFEHIHSAILPKLRSFGGEVRLVGG
jgi:hypothetical protein